MNIAIVGGGITGLVAAYRLLQKGYKVTIFEKNETVGGLLCGFEINGTNLEKAYHHIFTTDSEIINLINEIGLIDKLSWYPEKTALYFGDKMCPFNGPMDLLNFTPLPMADRMRTGLVSFYLQKDNNWDKYKKITAVDWIKKWNGDKSYKVIWEPLLRGKFHQYYDKVCMAWLWARIHTRGNSNGKLGYMDGGFGQIINKLVKLIEELGGEIKTKTMVKDIKGLTKSFNKVLMTGPIKGIEYLGAVEVVFASLQSLSSYYWHNINDSKSPFLAFIQHTNLVGTKNYQGEYIYYMGTYVPHHHHLFADKEDLIKNDFFNYLKVIFPNFDKKLITGSFVFKLANAQHIATTDYQVPAYETETKNVFQSNFAQIFPEDRGINYAVREGNKIALIMAR